ncbi:MAG TPA: ankyrin repeat domain-containing protein [Thermoanaerobaculia bacterium]|nr:ankyrin repeat domain-containing protein [Thermoanaerobaculia bacterium]
MHPPHLGTHTAANKGVTRASAKAVPALLGCVGSLAAAGLIAWIVWTFIAVHAATLGEDHLWWVIGASLALVTGLSALWGAITGTSDAKRIRDAVEGKPPVPHQRNAFIGTIRSGDDALRAPVTGTPAALYRYNVKGQDGSAGRAIYYGGSHMSAPVIQTRHGTVRILSFPVVAEFEKEITIESPAIESFLASRSFERKEPSEAASGTVKDFLDDDGKVAKDLQFYDRPENFVDLVLETDLVREGAQVCVVGTWNPETGSVGAGELIELLDATDGVPQSASKSGQTGCSVLFGLLLIVVSLLVLFVPLVPEEFLTQIPLAGDAALDLRAERVAQYIGERDYDSARRLAGLGLGTSVVRTLPTLTRELGLVEILLASGADPDSADTSGDTLLMAAEDPLIIERLLLRGADRSRRNSDGKTAGEEALARWDFGVATRLVEPAGEGEHLALAIRKAQDDELARLLSSGIDPDTGIELLDREVSPLYYASVFGNERAVELLLGAGASLDAYEAVPLQGAVEARSPEIVTRLIDTGADPSYTGHTATDPLFRAISFGLVEMVELLVSRGGGRDHVYIDLLRWTSDPRIKQIVSEAVESSG